MFTLQVKAGLLGEKSNRCEFTSGLHPESPYNISLQEGKRLFSNESFGELCFRDLKIPQDH